MQPTHQVIVSLISLVIIACLLAIYRYIYPKKKLNLFFVLMLLSLLLCISIFRKGGYESGDFNIHIFRTMSFYESLTEGHYLPSWAGKLNATYGYPLFIYNYPLPYYIISIVHFLKFSFIDSMKIFLAINIILSGVFMYIFSKSIFKNTVSAFVAAVFYLFVPYHLVDVHFKVVIGEILFFTLLPLMLFYIYGSSRKRILNILLAGLCFGLLIMAHVAIAFFTFFLIIIFTIIYRDKLSIKEVLFYTLTSITIGALISTYIWGVPLFMTKYTIYKQMITSSVFSVSLLDLIYSPYRYGLLFQGHKGEISNIIGYTQLLVILILTYMICFRKIKLPSLRKPIIFWLATFFILVFLITPYSNFFWRSIPFLTNLGNHRLLILVALSTSVLAGYLTEVLFKKHPKLIFAITIVTITYTILNWGQRTVLPNITDKQLELMLPTSTARGEGHFYADPKWVNIHSLWFNKIPLKELEVVKGAGNIMPLEKSTTTKTYIINANSNMSLRENTLYFPGWSVRVDKKLTKINYQKSALIDFNISKGLHYIEIKYDDIQIYKTLKIISLTSFVILLMGILIIYFRNKLLFTIRFMRDN